jgi:hemerythrin
MEVCSYPDLAKHKLMHHDILAQLGALEKEWYETKDMAIVSRLQKVLKDYWLVHMMQEDIKIVQYTTGKNTEIRKALDALLLGDQDT